MGKKGEGTFSEVLKAQDTKTGKYVAIKCMKNHFDSVEQVNRLREIQALRRLSPHANIIKLHEVLFDRSTGRLALVFELMDMNIYEMIRGRRQYIAEDKILHFMYQMMKGVDHMHRNGIFHRDIKPENVLVCGDALKLADFGSCRGIYSKQPFTEYISTRWYRAPECLLTDGFYNYKMDIWGVGCVFFEMMALYPLFPGSNEIDQINKIHNILGTPPVELLMKLKKHSAHMDFDFPAKQGTGITKLLPHASPDALDLMLKLLMYNPEDRISAKQALRHAYFREIRELDKKLRKQSKDKLDRPPGSGSALGEGEGDGDEDLESTQGAGNRDEEEPNSNRLPTLPTVGGASNSNLGNTITGGGAGSMKETYAGGMKETKDSTLPNLGGPKKASNALPSVGRRDDDDDSSMQSSGIQSNAHTSKKVAGRLVPLNKK